MKIKKESFLIILALLITVVLLYQIFISSQVECLKSLYIQYKSQKELLGDREKKLVVLDSLKETNLELQEKLLLLDAKFLKRDGVTSCLKELSTLAGKTGNVLLTISPVEQERETEGPIKEYIIRLKLKGQYANIIRFLNELQSQEELLIVDGLEMSVAQEGAPTLESQFKITYFIMDEEFNPLEDKAEENKI